MCCHNPSILSRRTFSIKISILAHFVTNIIQDKDTNYKNACKILKNLTQNMQGTFTFLVK